MVFDPHEIESTATFPSVFPLNARESFENQFLKSIWITVDYNIQYVYLQKI